MPDKQKLVSTSGEMQIVPVLSRFFVRQANGRNLGTVIDFSRWHA
jgi:hypothetical protein